MKILAPRSWLFSVALACLAVSAATAQAPEKEIIEALPDYLARRVDAQGVGVTTASFSRPAQPVLEQWISAKRWKPYDVLTVCFFEGNQDLRHRISEVASQWNKVGAKVTLDFGDINNPRLCRDQTGDIRVGFGAPGYWSLVGRDSLTEAADSEQSMNFARFNVRPPGEPEFSRVVLHEFGHALGFQHEHSIPRSVCQTDFRWDDYIYPYLAGAPNYWDKDRVDFNMRSGVYLEGDRINAFDKTSIMLYTFPVEFYRGGDQSKCYSPGNNTLSPGDKAALIAAYDPQKAQQVALDLARFQSTTAFIALGSDQKLSLSKSIGKSGFSSQQLRSLSSAKE